MAYDYGKLSSEERAEVLAYRRRKGFPLHAPPHPFKGSGCFLITAANFRHACVMATPERRASFADELLAATQDGQTEIHAWVILPNHYHVLLTTLSLRNIGSSLMRLHGRTSRQWNLADGSTGERRVWYCFMDRGIRDETDFYKAMNYLHYNPVKHGRVGKASEWQWSSIHDCLQVKGHEWLIEKWNAYPFGDFGEGWDE